MSVVPNTRSIERFHELEQLDIADKLVFLKVVPSVREEDAVRTVGDVQAMVHAAIDRKRAAK